MVNEYPERRGGVGCGQTIGTFLLMALGGGLLLVLLLIFGALWAGDRFFDGLNTMFNPPQPSPQVDVRSVVIQQIRGASELTTTVFTSEAIIPARQAGTLFGFEVTETTLLYIASGEVRAGVDLSELTAENVSVVSDTIRVTLPPPRILDAKIDVNRSRVYDYDRGFLGMGPDAPHLQTVAEQQGLQEIVFKACEYGILEEANEEAQVAVTQLMSTAGFREVIVEPQAPRPDACPTRAE